MQKIELSNNLILNGVYENCSDYDKLVTVGCYFTFFGEEGQAYVGVEDLDKEYPSYAMIEICSELSDSFNDQLEDLDNWGKIKSAAKEYVHQWNTIVDKWDTINT